MILKEELKKLGLHFAHIILGEVDVLENITLDLIEYFPESSGITTIIAKNTGNLALSSYDAGMSSLQRLRAFDTYIMILEGKGMLYLGWIEHPMEAGDSIIIPAHQKEWIQAISKLKLLTLVIKSGYEEV